MTRVLVVGTDTQGERALLERLHRIAGLPMGTLQACRDLDECQLLVVRDSPGLRNVAMRLRSSRPEMRVWVEGEDGALHDGGQDGLPKLESAQITAALNGQQQAMPEVGPAWPAAGAPPAAATAASRALAGNVVPLRAGSDAPAPGARPAAPAAAAVAVHGEHALARELRRGIRQRHGHGLLRLGQQSVLAIDFSSAQAVPLVPGLQHGLAEAAAWLGPRLAQMALAGISAADYLQQEQRGQRLPLRALLWQAAQQAGDWQRLDQRLAEGALIHLQGWPDFRVLARQQDVFRLCSLLVRRPSSLADCVHLLDLAPALVQTFVHGAFLAGYVRLDPVLPSAFDQVRTELRSQAPAAPAGGLLARMWRSVRAAARGS